MGKCNNKAVDLLLTTSYLILCDYLEFSTGSCPDFADKLSDIEEQTNKLLSSSDSDIDFGNEIIQREVGNVGLKRKISKETVGKVNSSYDRFEVDMDEPQLTDDDNHPQLFGQTSEKSIKKDVSKKNLVLDDDINEHVEKHELSPRKHAPREKIRKCLKQQRERMVTDQRGLKKLVVYNIGNCVSVSIPPIDHIKRDNKRIKGQIVAVKDFRRGIHEYKVATEFGTLNGWHSSSQIRSCSGIFNSTSDVDHFISIREATQNVGLHKSSADVCHCKNGCLDRRCTCIKRIQIGGGTAHCGIRCHNGQPWKISGVKINSFPNLPSYGGYITERDMSREYFSNTCSLDCWMTYFKIMQEQYPEQLENIIKENNARTISRTVRKHN